MQTKKYFNAKPSQISNLGADISGAQRMNFSTYENPEARKARATLNREKKTEIESYKKLLFADPVDKAAIVQFLEAKFEKAYGFRLFTENASEIIKERRLEVRTTQKGHAEFNKMLTQVDRLRRATAATVSEWRFSQWIQAERKKYAPKDSHKEETGKYCEWSRLPNPASIEGVSKILEANTNAVQFGNSVPDSERGPVLGALTAFLEHWNSIDQLKNFDISKISWSFGARGNGKSVAFYDNSRRLISVNRGNIGSLIHELGHAIDHASNWVSRGISLTTFREYRRRLPAEMRGAELAYYLNPREIFARAFEVWCARRFVFSEFAFCPSAFLPELNDNLINLIEQALGTGVTAAPSESIARSIIQYADSCAALIG